MHALVVAAICALLLLLLWAGFSLTGWLNMRRGWRKPVSWRDYRCFCRAVLQNDARTVVGIIRKYGGEIPE